MRNVLITVFLFFIILYASAQQPTAHDGKINVVKFSNDHSLVFSGGSDKIVRGWDVTTGTNLFILPQDFPVTEIFVSKDNKYLIASGSPTQHVVWDVNQKVKLKEFSGFRLKGFTSDDKGIVSYQIDTISNKAVISIISLSDFEDNPLYTGFISDAHFWSFDIFEENESLLLADKNDIRIHSLNNKQSISKIKLLKQVIDVTVSPDSRWVITVPFQGVVDLLNKKVVNKLSDTSNLTGNWKFASDGNSVIQQNGRNLLFFDLDTFSIKNKIILPEEAEYLQLSSNGQFVAYVKNNNRLLLFNAFTHSGPVELVGDDISEKVAYQNYLRGIYYYQQGDFNKAILLFTSSEGNTDRADKLYELRGDAYMQISEYENAVKDLRKDCQLNNNRNLLKLARAYVKNQEYDLAVLSLTDYKGMGKRLRYKELATDPVLTSMGQYPDWKRFLKQAEREKTEAESIADVSEKMFKRKNYIAALEFINKAIALEPNATDWLFFRAGLYLKTNEFEKAKQDYIMIAKIDSSLLALTYHGLAKASALKGELGKAIFWLKKTIAVDASLYNYMIDIADLELSRYERNEALTVLDEYLTMVPDDYYGYYLRASIRCTTVCEDIDRAIELCEQQGKPVPKEMYELQSTFK